MNNFFYLSEYSILIVSISLLLDFIFGDPEYKYHPVRLIGNLIFYTEKFFRKIFSNQKTNGLLFWLFIVLMTFSFSLLLTYLSVIFELFLVYSFLAMGDLRKKAFEIRNLLGEKKIDEARNKVKMIVGRDTENLNEKEIVRATIETVAENIVDGIISPLFYYALGGLPLMATYKAVNTLDSMVGYKNDINKDFGFFSAKIDDILNYIPARISAVIIAFSGMLIGKSLLDGIKIGLRDGQKNPSPNSGISEAVVAGLLKIELGGTNYYFGKKSEKSLIGFQGNFPKLKNISQTIYIAYISSLLMLIIVIAKIYFTN